MAPGGGCPSRCRSTRREPAAQQGELGEEHSGQDDRGARDLERGKVLREKGDAHSCGEDRLERVDRGRPYGSRAGLEDRLEPERAHGSEQHEVGECEPEPRARLESQRLEDQRGDERQDAGDEKLRGNEVDRVAVAGEPVDEHDEEGERHGRADGDEVADVPVGGRPRLRQDRGADDHDAEPDHVRRVEPSAREDPCERRHEDREEVGQKGRTGRRRKGEPAGLHRVACEHGQAKEYAATRAAPPASAPPRKDRSHDRRRAQKTHRDEKKRADVREPGARHREGAAPDDRREHEEELGNEAAADRRRDGGRCHADVV